SIAPYRAFSPAAYGSGFLGPKYAPLVVGDLTTSNGQVIGPNGYERALRVQDLEPPRDVERRHADSRLEVLQEMEKDCVKTHPGAAPQSHQTAYERAVRLMRTEAARAFDLDQEPDSVREAYGKNLFGQGCLLARRLVEQGVPFVEVSLGGVNGGTFAWDTHAR